MINGYVFLVEGVHDERFIEGVIEPELNKSVTTQDYSREPDPEVDNLVKTFDNMYQDLNLLRDYDFRDKSRIKDRMDFLWKKFPSLRYNNVVIVDRQIEGWYLAGLNQASANSIGITVPNNTEHIGKDEFNQKLKESDYSSRVNFQQEILNRYSIPNAKSKNESFRLLAEKLGI